MANQSALQVDKIIITRQNPEALEPLPPSELEYGELAVDQAGKLYTADKDNNVVVAGGGEAQEWSEIDNQTAAEPPNPRQADQLEGYGVQAIVEKAVEAVTLIDDLTPPEPETLKDADTLNGLSSEQIIENNGISLYIHSKTGTVHNFNGSGINGRAKMTANVETGDTFTVNGSPVTAYMGAESATDSMAGSTWSGKQISFVVDGDTLNFKGGGSKVTVSGLSAAVVKSGTTVTVKQGEKTITEVTGTLKAEERPVEYSFFNVQSHRYGGHSGTSYPENWNNTVIPGTYRAIYQTSILYRGFDAYFNINGSRAVNGKNYSFPNGSCNVSGGRGSNTHDDVEGACAMASLRLIKID